MPGLIDRLDYRCTATHAKVNNWKPWTEIGGGPGHICLLHQRQLLAGTPTCTPDHVLAAMLLLHPSGSVAFLDSALKAQVGKLKNVSTNLCMQIAWILLETANKTICLARSFAPFPCILYYLPQTWTPCVMQFSPCTLYPLSSDRFTLRARQCHPLLLSQSRPAPP